MSQLGPNNHRRALTKRERVATEQAFMHWLMARNQQWNMAPDGRVTMSYIANERAKEKFVAEALNTGHRVCLPLLGAAGKRSAYGVFKLPSAL